MKGLKDFWSAYQAEMALLLILLGYVVVGTMENVK